MSLTVEEGSKGGGNYERPEVGMHVARCYGIVDLGTHDNTHPQAPTGAKTRKVMLFFELVNELMEDGRPFVVNKRYTASLNEKSILRKELESWRGKAFTNEELAGFNLKNILNAPGMVNLVAKENKKKPDDPYINIASITPLVKGMEAKATENEPFAFEIEELNDPKKVAQVYPWVQKILAESDEGKAIRFVAAEKPANAEPASEGTPTGDDDETIPF